MSDEEVHFKRRRVDDFKDSLELPEPAAKRRNVTHTIADFGWASGRRAISLDNLCESWDEQPVAERPPVFFTVGHIAVPSSMSGVPATTSLCRQFWTWLGQTDDYDANRITFTMVNDQGIYMSVPNLAQFQVRLKLEPRSKLESVITLEPKIKDKAQVLKARTVMTSDYPQTAFKACPWWGCPDGAGPNGDDVLVDINAELRWPDEGTVEYPQLYIAEFYSKSSDPGTAPSLEPKSAEDSFLRGSGRRLLCQMLDSIHWVHPVSLDASGMSHQDQVYFADKAESMQVDDIVQDLEETVMREEKQVMRELKALNPHIFEKWKAEQKASIEAAMQQRPESSDESEESEGPEDPDLAFLRDDWVRIRANLKLVGYYMRTFGFRPRPVPRFTSVKMEATPDMIRRHCRSNALKDGDLKPW